MAQRKKRHFRIRTSSPTTARRFRNFIRLYGIRALARDITVHEATVQDWSSGRKLPSLPNLTKLIAFSESLLNRAKPPEDIFGDGRPLTFTDILDYRVESFGERPKP